MSDSLPCGPLVPEGVDTGLPWHYGDPLREQVALERGGAVVDTSNRDVVAVRGGDAGRLGRALVGAHVTTCPVVEPGDRRVLHREARDNAPVETTFSAPAYFCDPQGRILWGCTWVAGEQGEGVLYGVTEPGAGATVVASLASLTRGTDAEVAVRHDLVALWEPSGTAVDSGGFRVHTRAGAEAILAAGPVAGTWAYEALRIAAGRPRIGVDTDERTTLDELCGPAHGRSGGHPRRRLARLHLDGSEERFFWRRTPLTLDGSPVGFLGSMAYHHVLGPVGLGLVSWDVPDGAVLEADGVPGVVETVTASGTGRRRGRT